MKRFFVPGLLAVAGWVCLLAAVESEGHANCPGAPQEHIPAACYPPTEEPPGEPWGGCIDDGTGSCVPDGCEEVGFEWGSLIPSQCGIGYIREGSVDRCRSNDHVEQFPIHAWVTTCQIMNGHCTCFWVQTEETMFTPACVCDDLPPLTF